MKDSTGIGLQVLGRPTLTLQDGRSVVLDRKTAAVLSYLALEGPTSRSRLAGMLWPDSREHTARNNLVQQLRKLRNTIGRDVATGDDRLHLSAEVQLQNLDRAPMDGPLLLLDHDYDDCPGFEQWLMSSREGLQVRWSTTLQEDIRELEAQRDFAAAQHSAERWLALSPGSEEAHVALMRLHYIQGHRKQALDVFERCAQMLSEDYGAAPLPSTRKLAETIRQGFSLMGTMEAPLQQDPLDVLRPPALVGREREWRLLQQGARQRQLLLITGEAGCGKTRLALDFAFSCPDPLQVTARPGDRQVLYALLIRLLRATLAHQVTVLQKLPLWAQQELARLLPEGFPGITPVSLQAHDLDRLRLEEALAQMVHHLAELHSVLVFDDLQYADARSLDVLLPVLEHLLHQSRPAVALVFVSRNREAEVLIHPVLARLQQERRLLNLPLTHLTLEAVEELLSTMDLEVPAALTRQLVQYTGGHPLFVLEAVQHLLESNQLHEGASWTDGVPGTLGELLERRLSHLSPGAMQVAQAAAVLQGDFSVHLIAELLQLPLLQLMQAWQELENHQVFSGEQFKHDLIQEAVLRMLPPHLQKMLHMGALRVLLQDRASPVRLAHHALQAGMEKEAAAHLLQAARQAKESHHYPEAVRFFEQASGLLVRHDQTAEAFNALLQAGVLVHSFDHGAHSEALSQQLFRLVRSPLQEAQALLQKVRHLRRSEGTAPRDLIAKALLLASSSANRTLEAELHVEACLESWTAGDLEGATSSIQQALQISQEQDNLEVQLTVLDHYSFILATQEQFDAAIQMRERALSLAEQSGHLYSQVTLLNNLAFSHIHRGNAQTALKLLNRTLDHLSALEGERRERCRTLTFLGLVKRDLGQPQEALEVLSQAVQLASQQDLPHAYIHRALATVQVMLEHTELAEHHLHLAEQDPRLTLNDRMANLVTWARIRRFRQQDTTPLLTEMDTLIQTSLRRNLQAQLKAVVSLDLPPAEGLKLAQEALETVQRRDLGSLLAECETAVAMQHGRLGNLQEAMQHIQAAVDSLDLYTPVDFSTHHIHLTQAWILEELARKARQRAQDWITASRGDGTGGSQSAGPAHAPLVVLTGPEKQET